MDDGGEGVPQAQHLGGLHIVEVRRRNFGDRFVAVLQEVIRSLHLLSQRHEPIADVRVDEAVGDKVPRFAPLSEFLQL